MAQPTPDIPALRPTSPATDAERARGTGMLVPGVLDLDVGAVLAQYRALGWARLGRVMTDAALEGLRQRADDVMLGRVTIPGLFFQIDAPNGRYDDLTYGRGYEGPSLDYRKIEKLEKDPLYRAWLRNPLFERVARAWIDEPTITLYRSVLFAKGARGGSELPWHQDAGRFWGVDRDPTLQIWTALDDAGEDAGCVDVLPETHKDGLATPLGGVVPAPRVEERILGTAIVRVPARAGEALLLHNYLWHRSARNTTGRPRRAFTACYMPGSTRCLRTRRAPREFFRVWGAAEAPPGNEDADEDEPGPRT